MQLIGNAEPLPTVMVYCTNIDMMTRQREFLAWLQIWHSMSPDYHAHASLIPTDHNLASMHQ